MRWASAAGAQVWAPRNLQGTGVACGGGGGGGGGGYRLVAGVQQVPRFSGMIHVGSVSRCVTLEWTDDS